MWMNITDIKFIKKGHTEMVYPLCFHLYEIKNNVISAQKGQNSGYFLGGIN